jgi:hypothetical protein
MTMQLGFHPNTGFWIFVTVVGIFVLWRLLRWMWSS